MTRDDSSDIRAWRPVFIPASPGWNIIRLFADESAIYREPIIAWGLRSREVKSKEGLSVQVEPITVEGDVFDEDGWCIEYPDGKVSWPYVASYANAEAAIPDMVKEREDRKEREQRREQRRRDAKNAKL